MKMLFDLRDFWKRTSNFQKKTMLVYLKTCAPLLLIQSCLFGIHLPTWRTKHVSQLKLSAALSLNKFSLVIYIQFSQYKVMFKSIMKKKKNFVSTLTKTSYNANTYNTTLEWLLHENTLLTFTLHSLLYSNYINH